MTQYGDSIMYSLRHFDVAPRTFKSPNYVSPNLADDKRHGVLEIRGLRGDEAFQEAFRQLATTQDLILNDYRRINPSKNPPINLDYLDQMMGKEDSGKASEGIKKGSEPIKRAREEKKRIKAFLKEGKRKGELEQDWLFTYDPDFEWYAIETPRYWRKENFDTFEEASERLKDLDSAIELGRSNADGVLIAAAGDRGHGLGSEYTNRDAADALEENVYRTAYEKFGDDGDLREIAIEAYRNELHKEFAENAADYLPNGFSIRPSPRSRGLYEYELYAPGGTCISTHDDPLDVIERAQEEEASVDRENNPKRKRRKNPSPITIAVSYDEDSTPDEDLYEVMDTGGDFDDSWALPASDAASEVEDRKSHYEAKGVKVKLEGDRAVLRYVPNPRKKASKKRTKKPQHRKLIDACRKHWDAYCDRPTKTNLKKVFKHLEAMAESELKSVKDERRKCMRVAKAEAKAIKLKL